MPTIKEKIQATVARLEKEVKALAKRESDDEVALKPYPAATQEEIKRYEEYLGMKLPDSYRAFLETHNGYDWLVYPGHMLSIRAVLPGGKWHKKIQEWKKMNADYGSGEVLDAIVVANLGQPNNWVYLDPNQCSKQGEMTAVRWLSADTTNYHSLIDFLEARAKFCKNY